MAQQMAHLVSTPHQCDTSIVLMYVARQHYGLDMAIKNIDYGPPTIPFIIRSLYLVS
jgi:hypothetical protein